MMSKKRIIIIYVAVMITGAFLIGVILGGISRFTGIDFGMIPFIMLIIMPAPIIVGLGLVGSSKTASKKQKNKDKNEN